MLKDLHHTGDTPPDTICGGNNTWVIRTSTPDFSQRKKKDSVETPKYDSNISLSSEIQKKYTLGSGNETSTRHLWCYCKKKTNRLIIYSEMF